MGDEMTPSTKENLLTTIREIWTHVHKVCFFKIWKYINERIKAVIKLWGEVIRLYFQISSQ